METFIIAFVVAIVVGILAILITKATALSSGASLQKKFANLTKDTNGVIKGKSFDDIVGVCGDPNTVSYTNDGGKLCMWSATGCSIVLVFNKDNICECVKQQSQI